MTTIPELTKHAREAMHKAVESTKRELAGIRSGKANQLPIVVFNINQPGAIRRVLEGDRVGTIVR